MKKAKHIINGILWGIVTLYIILVIMLHIPVVQTAVGSSIGTAFSRKLGTSVSVGKVDLGFFNRIIINDINICDQQNKQMLHVSRISTKLDLLSLIQGKICISSAQMFGLNANLYKKDKDSKPNFQFIIDSLSSKDNDKDNPIYLKINSLVIRDMSVKYDQQDIPHTNGQFSPAHLNINNLNAHIIIDLLTNDSVNIRLRDFAFKEASGLIVDDIGVHVIAGKNKADINNLSIKLPHSKIHMAPLSASYTIKDGMLDATSLYFRGQIKNSEVLPSDFSCFENKLRNIKEPLYISSSFEGDNRNIAVKQLNVISKQSTFRLLANANISDWNTRPKWAIQVKDSRVTSAGIKMLSSLVDIPNEILKLGAISYRGNALWSDTSLQLNGRLNTDIGSITTNIKNSKTRLAGHIDVSNLHLGKILSNNQLGHITGKLAVNGVLKNEVSPVTSLRFNGHLSQLTYNSYTYTGIDLNGTYSSNMAKAVIKINDRNLKAAVDGQVHLSKNNPQTRFSASVHHINPSALRLTNKWKDAVFKFNIDANLTGNNLNTIEGEVFLNDLTMTSSEKDYYLSSLHLSTGKTGAEKHLSLNSDFGYVNLYGKYDYDSFWGSISNIIREKLPSLTSLFPKLFKNKKTFRNSFTIDAAFKQSDWLQQIFDIPVTFNEPLYISGTLNDSHHNIDMAASFSHFIYNNQLYKNGDIKLSTINDTININLNTTRQNLEGKDTYFNLSSAVADNHIDSHITFDAQHNHHIRGTLHSDVKFYKDNNNKATAYMHIHPSTILFDDALWNLQPADITYQEYNLTVDSFAIQHNKQHILVYGKATTDVRDTLFLELKDVDVSYVQDILSFHPVHFGGSATGLAYASGIFKQPQAQADLTVNGFLFEGGDMGTLHAKVVLNNPLNQLDIDAIASEDTDRHTNISGFVSPQRNDINLEITAHNTNASFVHGFCNSFMGDVRAHANGKLTLWGSLSELNLTGEMVVDGETDIIPTNTTYVLRNDTILFTQTEIAFPIDTIRDKQGNIGILHGEVRHEHLKDFTYSISADANKLLCFDFKPDKYAAFYGTIYATGACSIRGEGNELNIDVDATPTSGSEIVYNAASPDALRNNDFIHWTNNGNNALSPSLSGDKQQTGILHTPVRTFMESIDSIGDIATDIHMNFLIHSTPALTLKVIMDQNSGDHIALNGNGVLQATYFNKGGFDMFGNYIVDHGIYKLTIQNAIKKDFQFLEGGTISFGGDPYNAVLNLKAMYPVNGVSLSDLQLGRNFTSNNIRVNCLMNITGTPNQPRADFDLDLPTIGSDAKQMIYSLINSEQEMDQQVLYLLTIGRFYNPRTSTASADGTAQQNQASLAMQSILSGTLSQQINTILSSFVNNSNWNFGANISTGDEGWNNAEYEGLLSGRLLNNRLLINGQFGYRDNVNATSSFIGDFDVRYLLTPSGSVSVKVYNQTNDRYFTRNSLTTQGIGLLLKKDFNGLKDLFRIKRKSKKKSAENTSVK